MKAALFQLGYFIFWLLGLVAYHLPFALKKILASVGAFLFFNILGFRKRIVLHNLALVFPRNPAESMGEFQGRCESLAVKNYQHYVLSMIEILERFHWKAEDIQLRATFAGQDKFQQLVDSGRGFFFMTAHIGNWELLTRVGLILRVRLSIITKSLRNSFFDSLWVRARQSYGLELLDEENSGLKAMRSVKAGRAVGFILDQHIGPPHGIDAQFLGIPALCPRGLAVLSSRLRAPVIPAYMIRENIDGRFSLHVSRELDFSKIYENPKFWNGKQLTDEGIRAHVEFCNRDIERMVRQYPEQYLWLHKRFKNLIDYRSSLPWEL